MTVNFSVALLKWDVYACLLASYVLITNFGSIFLRGEVADMINLAGLDHVIICTAIEGKIYFRHYYIRLKKSGSSVRDPLTNLTFGFFFFFWKQVGNDTQVNVLTQNENSY